MHICPMGQSKFSQVGGGGGGGPPAEEEGESCEANVSFVRAPEIISLFLCIFD